MSWEPAPEELGTVFDVVSGLVFAAIFLAWALLVAFVAKGRNWARVALLVLSLAGWALMAAVSFIYPVDGLDWSSAVIVATIAMDLLALVLLFTGEGASWFAAQRSARRAADPQQPDQ